MKLLVTVPWHERLGGAEEMLWTYLRRLDQQRFEPVVVFFERGPFEREVAGLGFRTVIVETDRLRNPRALFHGTRRLARLLRAEDPDVVVNWSAKSHIHMSMAAAAVGMTKRQVWWQHAVPTGCAIELVATAMPAVAVGCSSHASASAQARLRPRRSTFVVHPGVEAISPRANVGRPRSGTARPLVGIVGRLQPWKGQHRFLEAIADLRSRGIDVDGVIVGGEAHGYSAGYADELKRLREALALREQVTMTGHVDDPRSYMASMDIVVSASEAEPFGIVLIEAMMEGAAVIAVDDSGPREIITHEQTGLLAPTSQPADLASAIGSLVADPHLRATLAAAGRKRALERFTAEHMARRLEAHLEELVSGVHTISQRPVGHSTTARKTAA